MTTTVALKYDDSETWGSLSSFYSGANIDKFRNDWTSEFRVCSI